jgi:hypothetical protein
MEVDKKDVCHGIIYPKPPNIKGFREYIETNAIELYSFPVYWYSEIRS